MQGTPVNIIVGSHIWVEDHDVSWIDGQVTKINGQEVEVKTSDGRQVVANLAKIYPKDEDAPAGGVDDMTKLSYLHEPGVLQNLASRYQLNEIYTYTGSILIAINPFQRLPHLYDGHMMEQYKGAPFGELSPHVFAIADVAFRAMINEGKSNSILVSGESGAGKTETTKMLMQYLAYLGGRKGTEGRTVEQQVLESNPVLEAFGNAKTVRNNNSSRFGKFVEIQFDKHGRISGAAIRTYLLERSRVCQVSDPERNYHCFYLLCAAPQEEVEKYKLGHPKTFRYLNQSNCYELVGISDAQEYLATRRAMDVVGISQKEQDAIFRVVASILHLGNVEFSKGKEIDSSVLKDDKSKFHLQTVAELLMCDLNALEDAILKRVMVTPEEVIKRSLDPDGAAVSRDGNLEGLLLFLMRPVAHYAGEVQYQSDQFLDKNKDYVVPEHQDLLCASKCPFVAGLFPPIREESTKSSNKSSKFSSIGSRFKLQLQQLMETLNSTEPHYIRCVKPNNQLKPAIFENVNIMQQLRCGGVLEAIRISCAGYPTRKSFYEFLNRFSLLAPEVLEGNTDEKTACKKLLEKMGLAGAQIGKTKIFLRAGQMAELDARRAFKLSNAAKTIQRKIRTHSARTHFLALQKSAICIQSLCRGRLACRVFDCMKREAASLKIQTSLRGHLARKNYTSLKYSVVILQTGIRAMAAHKEFRYKNQTKAGTIIQAHWRSHRDFAYYKRLIRASIVTQCRWRGRVARKELRKLKMASRETGALKEAKDKLEKQVEDLTLRLQLEKRLRTDLEEAKGQEIAKLQQSLQAMQSKVDDTNALLLKEREATQKAIEEASSIVQETPVPVEDTEKIDALTAEVENLKELLQSEKERADTSERKAAEVLESSNEKSQKLEETEKRVHQLQESLNRMIYSMSGQFSELKMILCAPTNLSSTSRLVARDDDDTSTSSDTMSSDSDFTFPAPVTTPTNLSSFNPGAFQLIVQDLSAAENSGTEHWENVSPPPTSVPVDGQHKASSSPDPLMLEQKLTNLESENKVLRQQALAMAQNNKLISRSSRSIMQRVESSKTNVDLYSTSMNARDQSDMDDRPQKSLNEKQQEYQDLLIRCVAQHLGFSKGRPVAACIIYKCLRQWHSFEAERTSIFDRIIQTIGVAIETQDNNDVLAYWLSNASTLLLMLQRTMKAGGGAGATPQHRRSPSATLFGRMTQSFRSTPQGVNLSLLNDDSVGTSLQVEAKYPALLFKQQLTAYVEKIYGMIRDNLKKEISPLLGLCIQAPRISRANLIKGTARTLANAAAQEILIAHWQGIVKSLANFLNILKANNVPPFLVRKVFTQIFSFVNVQLFNSLLLRRECCSFSNGEYVKAGLAELEHWCYKATEEYTGSSWDELKHIRQAIGFLVIHQKPKKTLDEISHDLCPVLSVQQLYRISTMYWDDKYGTHSLSQDVISKMRVLMTEDSNNAVSSSFLLDDDSSIPFSVDDLSKSMDRFDISDIEPPPLIRENSGFSFLLPQAE
ncbi:unnamed protein product [Fraxinus pennsylvanica]|uniref:Myosin XI n=1 Tax=Fraxinus pennsylvanica TaxID=56036 RepID=A0AAD2A401_9LAMI|nr:unnamed protein product [Fraxinus pennsylvanica]